MKTEYDIENLHEDTDIVFKGYLAHYFENEQLQNIIFDIERNSIIELLEQEKDLFTKKRNYGWPISYNTTDDLLKHLQDGGYYCFDITSSYGLYGFVIAKDMEINTHKNVD